MVRVIFLDIDGVICCNNQMKLEKDKMDLLCYIVKVTGASVVISSNWRNYQSLKNKLLKELKANNIQCLGATPRYKSPNTRPCEIIAWINAWNKDVENEVISKYVVIDDRPLLSEKGGALLEGSFCQTESLSGLTEKISKSVVRSMCGFIPGQNGRGKYHPIIARIPLKPGRGFSERIAFSF